MNFDLSGRIALVTGAGRGVGFGIARQLLIAGATVAVNDLLDERAAEAATQLADFGTALPFAFDVTDTDAVDSAMSRIEETVGGVDVLVHNAGVAPDLSPALFLDYPEATLRGQLELNTIAAATVFRRALPGQIDRGWGRLIQISSGASATGLGIGVSAYGASKAATEALVRHIAVEYGSTGVTANSLALGLMDNVVADGPLLQTMVDSIPRRALGQPDEVGAAVVWLASELGSVVTGQVVHLNGGTLFGR